MESGPITSWPVVGESVEAVRNFIFLGSKITTYGDCSHEIKKKCLLLEMKAITNLDSILQSRDMTLLTKVCIVKSMSRCELDHKKGWVLKNWCFQTWCWRRFLTVPWTASISKESILKEINPEYSLEGLMLRVKLQYFATWCEKLIHWKRLCYREWLKAKGEEGGNG